MAWDPATHRRECTIPPEQLAKLNALPGWQRTFQAAPLDETPDDSPTNSQQPGLGGVGRRLTAGSPGAHARKQRAPVMSFDDDDEEDEDADARVDVLVRLDRSNPELMDPQTKGLRGVATKDPPRATALDLAREKLERLADDNANDAFSPVRTRRGKAADKHVASKQTRKARESINPTQAWEDIVPTQPGPDVELDPASNTNANRGAASALAALFSPVTTRARRATRGSTVPAVGLKPQGRGLLSALRGVVGLGNAGGEKDQSNKQSLPEDSGGEEEEEFPDFRSPFGGRNRQKRRDDAASTAAWENFTEEALGPVDMSKQRAAAVINAATMAAVDTPLSARRGVSAFGDQGGDAVIARGDIVMVDAGKSAPPAAQKAPLSTAEKEKEAQATAQNLVSSRFSTGKKRKRASGVGGGEGIPVVTAPPVVSTAEKVAPNDTPDVDSPVDAMLHARFSGKQRKKSSTLRLPSSLQKSKKGIGALVDVDGTQGDDTGTPPPTHNPNQEWYVGGTAEKTPVSAEDEETEKEQPPRRATRGSNRRETSDLSSSLVAMDKSKKQEKVDKNGLNPKNPKSPNPKKSQKVEEEFVAALADVADGAKQAAVAKTATPAGMGKQSGGANPKSVSRAISFDGVTRVPSLGATRVASMATPATRAPQAPLDSSAVLLNMGVSGFRGKRVKKNAGTSSARKTKETPVSGKSNSGLNPQKRSVMSMLGLE